MKKAGDAVKAGLIVITVLALAAAMTGCAAEDGQPVGGGAPEERPFSETVELKGHRVELELALTPGQRQQGLMGRAALADDEGMLFVFPDRDPYPAELNFWMKDCLIPIDVIFISREGFVTAIHEMQPPEPGTADEDLEAYSSIEPAQFAIELRGGLAGELGLETGDQIYLRKDYLLELAE